MLALLAGFRITYEMCVAQRRLEGGIGQGAVRRSGPAGLGDGLIVVKAPGRLHASEYLPWLAPFWIAGVLFFQLRGVASWMAARGLRRKGVCAATRFWQERIDRLGARVRLSRAVTLLESCLAEVPVVIGYVRPVILMPVGLLAGFPAGQGQYSLPHPLAHTPRHDYPVHPNHLVVG